jgi:hypothetical protein
MCYRELLDEPDEQKGDLVYFKKWKSNQKWEDAIQKAGFVGQPSYAE